MRVGLVLSGFSASERDWCIPALLDFVRSLAPRHSLRVLTLRYPHTRMPYDLVGARVIPLDGRQRRGLYFARLWPQALTALAREHRRAPFDLLHAFFADEPGLVAALAGRLLHIPVVVSLVGGELVRLPDISYGSQLSLLARHATRVALALAGRVTAGSQALCDLARPRLPAGKLFYAPLGVDLAQPLDRQNGPNLIEREPGRKSCFQSSQAAALPGRFAPPAGEPDPFRLLCVASLTPVKNHPLALETLRRVVEREPRASLQLAGSGPQEPRLRELASRLGLAGRVEFLGAVAHDELPRLYHSAALLLLTSRFEAQGMAVLEAAACSLPSVGTPVGALAELAQVGAARAGPPPQLAESVLELLGDPAARLALGRRAYERAAEEYSLDRCRTRWEQVYTTVPLH